MTSHGKGLIILAFIIACMASRVFFVLGIIGYVYWTLSVHERDPDADMTEELDKFFMK